jgi:predicted dehydrogenase
MSVPVKVGVVGVGHMGKEHARIYAESTKAELVGVFDTDPHTAKKIADKCRTRVFTALPEMVEAVEAVSVVTPTVNHLASAEPFLKKGRHVLVEKPIAMDTKEARELVTLAEKNGAKLAVGHVERFNPVLAALEERLGRPRFIEAHRLSPYPGRSTDIGVVMDLMIHDLEIILHLVRSPVKSVDAVGVPVLSKGEDIANARIRLRGQPHHEPDQPGEAAENSGFPGRRLSIARLHETGRGNLPAGGWKDHQGQDSGAQGGAAQKPAGGVFGQRAARHRSAGGRNARV